jgi:hypothetical protein
MLGGHAGVIESDLAAWGASDDRDGSEREAISTFESKRATAQDDQTTFGPRLGSFGRGGLASGAPKITSECGGEPEKKEVEQESECQAQRQQQSVAG